jgi:hypothetical protein
MAPKKPGKLTIGILLGKPDKGKPEGDSMGGTMDSEDQAEGPEEEELPPGLLEAVTEFRAAETDEEAAKALYTAIQCCEGM